jgi:diadenosine tetraphosphate (Ap4A) HIT family hydrolase
MFTLHPQLEQDCLFIKDLPLCRLLLMNDATFPWCVLVPRRDNIREIHELSEQDQQQLTKESSLLSRSLQHLVNADKMNVAALGNVVPQLHVHHIARYVDDPAWPGPVWGKVPASPYTEEDATALIKNISESVGSS